MTNRFEAIQAQLKVMRKMIDDAIASASKIESETDDYPPYGTPVQIFGRLLDDPHRDYGWTNAIALGNDEAEIEEGCTLELETHYPGTGEPCRGDWRVRPIDWTLVDPDFQHYVVWHDGGTAFLGHDPVVDMYYHEARS